MRRKLFSGEHMGHHFTCLLCMHAERRVRTPLVLSRVDKCRGCGRQRRAHSFIICAKFWVKLQKMQILVCLRIVWAMSEQYVTLIIKMPFYASLKQWIYNFCAFIAKLVCRNFAQQFGSSNPPAPKIWHSGTLIGIRVYQHIYLTNIWDHKKQSFTVNWFFLVRNDQELNLGQMAGTPYYISKISLNSWMSCKYWKRKIRLNHNI